MLEIVNILLALYTIKKELRKAAKVIKLITDFLSVRRYLPRQRHDRDYYGVVWMCSDSLLTDKSRGEICMSHMLWLCGVFTVEEIQLE